MTPDAVIGGGALWLALPLAAIAGLVSFVSPCVLPLVPGYLGFLTGAVTPRPRRADRVAAPAGVALAGPASAGPASAATTVGAVAAADAPVGRGRLVGGVLLFIAGFTAVFVVAVILGGAAGRFLIAYQDVLTRVLGVVVILLGLVFTGAFGLAQRTARLRIDSRLGLVGAPLLGVALGLGWTPCIGPTLAAIIAVSYNLGDPGRGVLLGLAYSAGLGIPFVALALGLGWATRSVAFIRRHLRAFNIAGGALLIGVGLLMVTGLWTGLLALVQGMVANVPLPL